MKTNWTFQKRLVFTEYLLLKNIVCKRLNKMTAFKFFAHWCQA